MSSSGRQGASEGCHEGAERTQALVRTLENRSGGSNSPHQGRDHTQDHGVRAPRPTSRSNGSGTDSITVESSDVAGVLCSAAERLDQDSAKLGARDASAVPGNAPANPSVAPKSVRSFSGRGHFPLPNSHPPREQADAWEFGTIDGDCEAKAQETSRVSPPYSEEEKGHLSIHRQTAENLFVTQAMFYFPVASSD